MSADTATQAEISRATRALVKGAGARLAGKKRGPDRRVRRNSVDVGDHRARVWVKINGGDRRGGLRWCDTLKRTAREYDLVGKRDGKQGPIGLTGRIVLEALLELVDFRTGRLEPTYAKLMTMTKLAKSTISAALRRLRIHGFIDWVRRSHVVETDEGTIAREQTSNAYYFDFARMAKAARLRFQQLLARRERAAEPPIIGGDHARAGAAAREPLSISDPGLAAALARLGAAIDQGAE